MPRSVRRPAAARALETMTPSFRVLALRGAASLAARATPTTLGVRFPEREESGLGGRYDFSLYDGAAGVGLVLADLQAGLPGHGYPSLLEDVMEGLGHSVPDHKPIAPGLYTGFGGVALGQLAHARLTGSTRAMERSVALATRLARTTPPGADLLSGAAGMGILQLALLEATGSAVFRKGAQRAADYLGDTALKDGARAAWAPGVDDGEFQPGLAHGVAGPCLFLTRFTALTGTRSTASLRDAGFRWLDANADRVNSRSVTWPRYVGAKGRRYHWCHGAVGVAQAYLANYRHTGNLRALQTALDAAHGAWVAAKRRRSEATCHCHGLAGAIELFLDLQEAGATGPWRQRAQELALRLIGPEETRTPGGRLRIGPHTLGGLGTGLEMGTAGVVRILLRLSGHRVFPILTGGMGPVVPVRATGTATPRTPLRCRRPKGDLAQLLPRIAGTTQREAPTKGRSVILGAPDEEGVRQTLRALGRSDAGSAWFRAHGRLTRGCSDLARRYADILAPGALGPASAGALLREVAGLSLRPGADRGHCEAVARASVDRTLASLGRMLARLEGDLPGVLSGDVGGRITAVVVHGGDPHRGGERVVALEFENGPGLMYKSRSVALDRELAGVGGEGERPTLAQRCRGWLRPAVEGGVLATHRVVHGGPRHGYTERIVGAASPIPTGVAVEMHGRSAWESPVAWAAQLNPGEARRYWYGAGLLAGHAFSLGISDLHLENVRCGTSRSTPGLALHAVDLEVAFTLVDDLTDTGLVTPSHSDPKARRRDHSHAGMDAGMDLHCGVAADEWVLELTARGIRRTPLARGAAHWSFPHLARHADGSFGYRSELCVFLRGMADQWWTLRKHRAAVEAHLRDTLTGCPVRFLAKATQSYTLSLDRRKGGNTLTGEFAHGQEWPNGLPLSTSELRQLEELDYPYFFQPLRGARREAPQTHFIDPGTGLSAPAPEFDSLERVHAPFWSILRRQGEGRFAAALVDAVRAVQPPGPFDFHDRELGVRVFRTHDDHRTVIVVLLGERLDARLTVRAAPDGSLEWRVD